jgi:hypothetical protein
MNEQKRIKTIAVMDKEGKTVNVYAPNHIGSQESKLKAKAQKEAKEIGGTIRLGY